MTDKRWTVYCSLLVMIYLLMPMTALAILAAGCGKGDRQTMKAPSISEADFLLEMIIDRSQSSSTGIRVYTDGRYDSLSDTQIDVAPDGKNSTRRVPLAWRTVMTYSANELNELSAAIQSADFPSLQQRYAPSGTVHDGGTQTWRVWLKGTRYEVKVEGYPVTTVPALETLFRRLSELRKLAPSSSIWRVWVGGTMQQRNVNCDASAVVELRPLLQAIFNPQQALAGSSPIPSAVPHNLTADMLLVDILWHEQGRPDDRTLVYGDGRVLSQVEGQQSLLRTLNGAQLAQLLEAGANIKWAQLPDPVCG
ncbi:MAG: hypothetical protein AB7P24_02915 [Nitrospira sp.]